jgi:ornithine cyclodeaminase
VLDLGDLVTGKVAGRGSPSEVTLFKSLGIGLEDVALAELVYRRTRGRRGPQYLAAQLAGITGNRT